MQGKLYQNSTDGWELGFTGFVGEYHPEKNDDSKHQPKIQDWQDDSYSNPKA